MNSPTKTAYPTWHMAKPIVYHYRYDRWVSDHFEPIEGSHFCSAERLDEGMCNVMLHNCGHKGRVRLIEDVVHTQIRAEREG